jgi:hypothetical protein
MLAPPPTPRRASLRLWGQTRNTLLAKPCRQCENPTNLPLAPCP